MTPLRVTATFRIQAGKEEAFRLIIRTLESAVRAHDKGTLIYDWYVSPDGLPHLRMNTMKATMLSWLMQ
jgi:quinol monooxygenase YgiN